jgi:hypothetical protein
MRQFFTKVEIVGAVVALTVVVSSYQHNYSVAAQAKQMEISGTFTLGQPDSEPAVMVQEDSPTRALVQLVRKDELDSSNPDFSGAECTVNEQLETFGVSGSHRGYSYCVHKNGDKSYFRYEGTQVVTTASTCEAQFQGTFQILGGTGKFQNLRGEGVYMSGDHGMLSIWRGTVEY